MSCPQCDILVYVLEQLMCSSQCSSRTSQHLVSPIYSKMKITNEGCIQIWNHRWIRSIQQYDELLKLDVVWGHLFYITGLRIYRSSPSKVF